MECRFEEMVQNDAKETEASRENTREAKGQAHTQWVGMGRLIRAQLEQFVAQTAGGGSF